MFKTIVWIMTAIAPLSLIDAHAQPLEPLQPAAFDLGKESAIVYYVDNDGTYDVIAMIGPNVAIEGPVVRHLVRLESDERYTVSVGGKSSTTATSYIEIERVGDTLSVVARKEQGAFEKPGLR
jgi:hypothetical protein